MAKEIRWTWDALETYGNIIAYLNDHWTEKEIEKFMSETESAIDLISLYPFMFKKYNKHNVREALITKHNLMVYKAYDNHIDILYFWDTRQDPKGKGNYKL